MGREFIKAYTKGFKSPPDLPAVFGYESMEIGIQAIRALGAPADNREALLDTLHARRFTGLVLGTAGQLTFDDHGSSTLASLSLYEVKRSGALAFDAALP